MKRIPGRMIMRITPAAVCTALLVAVTSAGAAAQGRDGASAPAHGVKAYPGATERPDVARAVEAFYRAGLREGETLAAAVYETPASFEDVYRFYAPYMEDGKWGWRQEEYSVREQAATWRFARTRLAVDDEGEEGALPGVFAPLLGDPALEREEFEARLERLVQRNPDVEIRVAEGTRRVMGDRGNARVRVMLEGPYLDLGTMTLVDRTRIIVLTSQEAEDSGTGGEPGTGTGTSAVPR